MYNAIGQSNPKFVPKVLRALKKNIYELVSTNDPQGRIHVLDIEDIDNMDKVDFVLGVGAKTQFGDEGYSGLEPKDLFEDLLYDNQSYDHEKIVFKTLPKLLKTHSNSIPVFKYVKDIDSKLPDRVFCYVRTFSTFDSHLNNTIRKSGNLSDSSIEEVRISFNLHDPNGAQKCLDEIFRLKENNISVDELQKLLKDLYEMHPNLFNLQEVVKPHFRTSFRRAAKIFDWMKYHEDKK